MNEQIFNIDDIVLIDTCTFINLENYRSTNTTIAVFMKVIDLDCPLCISDLSMVELILGCDKEDDLNLHIDNLKDMEITIFGRYDVLKKYLEPDYINRIIGKRELNAYKEAIKAIRNKILSSLFQNMFLSYCQIVLMMMQIADRQYWDGAFFLIDNLAKNNRKILESILLETMCEYFDNKKESKFLLSESFKALLTFLLPQIDGDKYNELEVETRLNSFDYQRYFLKLFKSLNLKKDIEFGDFCYIKPMMERFKKNVQCKDLEEELTKDGINYAIMYILSKRANFDSHDLIDLLNISMSGYKNINIHYYTDENKWMIFAKIEQAINNRCHYIDVQQINKHK